MTVIRHLMGFSKPDSGGVCMAGMDCWRDSAEIMRHGAISLLRLPSLATRRA